MADRRSLKDPRSPLVLALEPATAALSVALLRGPELIDEISAAPGPAAATLLPAVDTLLDRAGVSIGPGSFTSLRVGIATLKGLAFESGLPIAPVSTLAALARVADRADRLVVSMLDARRGEVYAAAYAADSDWEVVVPEGVYTPEALCAQIRPPCVLVGEGAAICGEAIVAALGEGVALLPPPEGNASARHVGALGVEQLARGSWVDAAQLAPHYLRRAEAEVKRTGERFEPAPGPPKLA
ncbi:MAG: tRNA (adenosine(37)-N6)-threonylcarbamoyltransferase complex dimerization subunit type 1 TsaB [Deltaproteobacteria bacterium]|nr:tRNA (adenosine(37)-N6)-threonylcarbamoyltransferase complex dimerization subunit type 1 TsaB [Deltaproteobacteria bacterium]